MDAHAHGCVCAAAATLPRPAPPPPPSPLSTHIPHACTPLRLWPYSTVETVAAALHKSGGAACQLGPFKLFDSFCHALGALAGFVEPALPPAAALSVLHRDYLAPLFKSLFGEGAGFDFQDPAFAFPDEEEEEAAAAAGGGGLAGGGGGCGGAASVLTSGRSGNAAVTGHLAGHLSITHARLSRLVLHGGALVPRAWVEGGGGHLGAPIPIGVLDSRACGASWKGARLLIAKNPSSHTPVGVLPAVVGAASGVGLFASRGGQ